MKKAVNIDNCHHCTFTLNIKNSEHAVNIQSSEYLNIKELKIKDCQKGISINNSWDVGLNNIDINLIPKSIYFFKETHLAACIKKALIS